MQTGTVARFQSCFRLSYLCKIAAFSILFFTVLTIFRAAWCALHYAPVNPDAGYYLATARLLAEGKHLFLDLAPTHSSAVLYAFAALLRTGFSGYSSAILLVLGANLFTALMIILIGKRMALPIFGVFLSALCYLLFVFQCEGDLISLEPFVNAAIACALLSAVSSAWFAAGFFSGVAIVCKQYGGFPLAAITLLPLLDRLRPEESRAAGGNIKVSFLPLFGGAALPLAVYYGLFLIEGVDPSQLLWTISGGWYRSHSGSAVLRVISFFYRFPVLALALVSLPAVWRKGSDGRLVLCGFLLSFLPLSFAVYRHYLMFPLFLGCLLCSFLCYAGHRWLRCLLPPLFYACLLYSAILTWRHSAVIINENPRAKQIAAAQTLSAWFKPGSAVMNLAAPEMNVLVPWNPPAPDIIGFGFLEHRDEPTLSAWLKTAKCAAYDPERLASWPEERRKRFSANLGALGFSKLTVVENTQLWSLPGCDAPN